MTSVYVMQAETGLVKIGIETSERRFKMATLPRIKIGSMEPAHMSDTEIRKEVEKLDEANSLLCDILIDMGLGHCHPDDMYRDHADKPAVQLRKALNTRLFNLQWEARQGRGHYSARYLKGGYRRMGRIARCVEAH